jgi:hypothetical protein
MDKAGKPSLTVIEWGEGEFKNSCGYDTVLETVFVSATQTKCLGLLKGGNDTDKKLAECVELISAGKALDAKILWYRYATKQNTLPKNWWSEIHAIFQDVLAPPLPSAPPESISLLVYPLVSKPKCTNRGCLAVRLPDKHPRGALFLDQEAVPKHTRVLSNGQRQLIFSDLAAVPDTRCDEFIPLPLDAVLSQDQKTAFDNLPYALQQDNFNFTAEGLLDVEVALGVRKGASTNKHIREVLETSLSFVHKLRKEHNMPEDHDELYDLDADSRKKRIRCG